MVKLLPILLACMLPACLPIDQAIAPVDRGPTRTITASIGNTYGTVVYYSLDDDRVVLSVPLASWHLTVETRHNEPIIRLNSGLVMRAAAVDAPFNDIITAPATGWEYDTPDGFHGPMISWWKRAVSTYVVHLGFDERGKDLGMRKVDVQRSADGVELRIARLNGSEGRVVSIPFEQSPSRVGVDLLRCAVVRSEPAIGSWDLMATRYTHIFRDTLTADSTPYSVTGVFVDPTTTRCARIPDGHLDSTVNISEETFPLMQPRDVLGYDWKSFSLETGQFSTLRERRYVLQTRSGRRYVLQPVDFYDVDGSKGAMQFTIRPL